MSHTIHVKHPNFPEGLEINVGNLGRVPNGDSMEVSAESERLFVMSNGRTLADAFANDPLVTVTGVTSLSEYEVDSMVQSVDTESTSASPVEDTVTSEEEKPVPAWLGGEQSG